MSLREWITSFPVPTVATAATVATPGAEARASSQLSQLSQGSGAGAASAHPPALWQLSQVSQTSSRNKSAGASVDLRDLAPTALRFRSLVTCEDCQHFESRPADKPDGWCHLQEGESWARVPFECAAYIAKELKRPVRTRR